MLFRALVTLAVLCLALAAGPLAAQAPADSAAVRAVALRETPERHRATARVTGLTIRGDTAVVTVELAVVPYAADRVAFWNQTLTLARHDSGWVALPRRTVSVSHGRPR